MTGITAAQKRARIRGRVVAWIMVGFFAVAVVILNVYDVLRTGQLDRFLAFLVAVIPVIAYVGLSEIVAIFRGWLLQILALASLAVGMMLTTTAVANVVEPVTGPWRCWFYGGVMDLPLAIGLYVIMNKPADCRDLMGSNGPSLAAALGQMLTRKRGEQDADGPAAAPRQARTVAPQPAQPQAPPMAHEPAGAMAQGPQMDHGPSAGATDSGEPENASRNQVPSLADATKEKADARARYLESAEAGEALSDRALAAEFGRSRNWGKARIAEARESDQIAEAR
jgi:hypothetical protein